MTLQLELLSDLVFCQLQYFCGFWTCLPFVICNIFVAPTNQYLSQYIWPKMAWGLAKHSDALGSYSECLRFLKAAARCIENALTIMLAPCRVDLSFMRFLFHLLHFIYFFSQTAYTRLLLEILLSCLYFYILTIASTHTSLVTKIWIDKHCHIIYTCSNAY